DGVVPGCVPILKRAPGISQTQLQNNNGAGWPSLAFEDISVRGRGETDNHRSDRPKSGLHGEPCITHRSAGGQLFMITTQVMAEKAHISPSTTNCTRVPRL